MESSYIFTLDYGKRMQYKQFVKDILNKFDNQKLVGVNLFINNNPYNFELYLHLNFDGDVTEFEDWLEKNYKNMSRKYNYFVGDFLYSMSHKGYNSAGLVDSDMADFLITSESNGFFLFPDETLMNEMFKSNKIINDFKVFLSHSSKDKKIVNSIFNQLQKAEIKAWYDRYEIDPGDSIVDKINEGLSNSDTGILLLSKNFLDPSSGWTKSEMNYFIQKRMKSKETDFICLNLNLSHDELPPLVQEYRYIDMNDEDAIEQLIHVLRKKKANK